MVVLVNAVPEVIHQYLQGLMKKKYGLLSMACLNLLHMLTHMVIIKGVLGVPQFFGFWI